ncbi:MAG: hypothetical protein JWP31_1248 [Aeromicrobium sp.]|nr:hypothetical protein [Aeromicrobium sp.]
MSTLLRDVEVDGRVVDVLLQDGTVAEIGPGLDDREVDEVVDGGGAAALPGLHDHHLHLMALAAARRSVMCGPPHVRDRDRLRRALVTARGDAHGWVRGTAYHESVAGPLDRAILDDLVPDRPVRVQHRSGALWMLNTRALEAVGMAQHPDGRLWRMDADLRAALPTEPTSLGEVGHDLTTLGITGVTDATPDLGHDGLAALVASADDPRFRAGVLVLGAPDDPGPLPPAWAIGPVKLLLHDHDLPDYPELLDRVRRAHGAGRPVAVHCVTRESLLLTLAVLDETGAMPGDRIEHAAVVPLEVRARMAALGLRVVTQPGFLRTRGDDYLRDVAPDDVPLLYPWARLCAVGVRVSPSSDAPYGELDPWRVIADAVARRSETGAVIGEDERVTARAALDGYLSRRDDPGGPPRRLAAGAPADVCLLHVPIEVALAHPRREHVRRVWHAVN